MRKFFLAFVISLFFSLGLLAGFNSLMSELSIQSYLMFLAPLMLLSYTIFFKAFQKFTSLLKLEMDQKDDRLLRVIFTLIFGLSFFSIFITGLIFEYKTKPSSLKVLQSVSKQLLLDYDIYLSYDVSDVDIEGFFIRKIDMKEVSKIANAYEIIHKEITKYPKSFFKEIGMKHIYVGRELLSNGDIVGGLSVSNKQMILLDGYEWSNFYIKGLVHHEIFHQIMGYVGKSNKGFIKEWNDLNDKDFTYIGSYKCYLETERNDPLFSVKNKGFVSTYSKKSYEEDMCEIYKDLCSSKWTRKNLAEKVKVDSIIEEKMVLMEKFLKDHFQIEVVSGETISLKKVPPKQEI